jgi:hypothetical protein
MTDPAPRHPDALVNSLRVLEEKLSSSDGIEPLVALLGEIEGLLVNVEDDSLGLMRAEIRSVIDRLLVINGDMQRIAQLKKILP